MWRFLKIKNIIAYMLNSSSPELIFTHYRRFSKPVKTFKNSWSWSAVIGQ